MAHRPRLSNDPVARPIVAHSHAITRPSQWMTTDMAEALERKRRKELPRGKVELSVSVPKDGPRKVALQLEVLVADPEVRRALAAAAANAEAKAAEARAKAEAKGAAARIEEHKRELSRRTGGLSTSMPTPWPDEGGEPPVGEGRAV